MEYKEIVTKILTSHQAELDKLTDEVSALMAEILKIRKALTHAAIAVEGISGDCHIPADQRPDPPKPPIEFGTAEQRKEAERIFDEYQALGLNPADDTDLRTQQATIPSDVSATLRDLERTGARLDIDPTDSDRPNPPVQDGAIRGR